MTDAARMHSLALSLLLLVGCASVRSGTELYSMPSDPAKALSPEDADPSRPGELAEAALYLLDPERSGGPDYVGAARLCLLASDVADPRSERELRRACQRLAARSALRAGDRELYIEAVGAWEREASRGEKAAGELSVHVAIRDRLCGRMTRSARVPRDLRRLLPPLEVGG